MKKLNRKTTAKRLVGSVVVIILLSVCLAVTTFALVWSMVAVDNNLFQTGVVKINLNDGQPVIREDEFLFEPGMTVKKDFFLENESTWDVYYKLYFTDVEGGLADVLDVTVKDGDAVLLSGKMSDLTKEKAGAADDALRLNEHREMSIWFHFPENAGNEAQNLYLSFTMSADAVQTKNNPYKLFD